MWENGLPTPLVFLVLTRIKVLARELGRKEEELVVYAIKRVAAGAHVPTPRFFEPAKRPDDRADFCMDCSFLPSASTRYSFLKLNGVGRALWAYSGEGSAQ